MGWAAAWWPAAVQVPRNESRWAKTSAKSARPMVHTDVRSVNVSWFQPGFWASGAVKRRREVPVWAGTSRLHPPAPNTLTVGFEKRPFTCKNKCFIVTQCCRRRWFLLICGRRRAAIFTGWQLFPVVTVQRGSRYEIRYDNWGQAQRGATAYRQPDTTSFRCWTKIPHRDRFVQKVQV